MDTDSNPEAGVNNGAANGAANAASLTNDTATPPTTTTTTTATTNNDYEANDEDVIPNAIVIKNIPFAIKKEQLLDIIQEMGLPLPYAFNYHFDNGIFRGLAFANFSTPEDTSRVISDLNGKEINGRKLKVEYKKMLPQAERERIEREKREKRGQLEEQHRSMSNLSLSSMNRNSNNTNNSNVTPAANTTNLLSQQLFSPNLGSLSTMQNSNIVQPMANQSTSGSMYSARNSAYQNDPNTSANMVQQQSAVTERYYAPLPAAYSLPLPPQQLDLNDPDTLEIYSQLLLFKDREKTYYELAYPVGVSANHKRIINVLCSYLNLVEVYDPRFIIIRRKVLNQNDLQSHILQNQQSPQVGTTENNAMMHPLQASSTGGSMNRSHSYTNLLQTHAAAAAAGTTTASYGLGVTAASSTGTPKITQLAQQMVANQQSQQQNASAQGHVASTSSPVISVQSNPLFSGEQQQSLLRQTSGLTASSRIPSGYSSNQMYNNVNPLLRNNGISPPAGQTALNMTSIHNNQRIPQGFPASASQLQQQQQQQQQTYGQNSNPLIPQHTNESAHSNYSLQSLHDDLMNQQSNTSVLGNSISATNTANASDMIYRTLSQSRYEDGLEQGLNRSLSALDLTGKDQENSSNDKNAGWP
ncbi:related to RNA-binding protein PIN4 [Nakaseomyces glabratus]|nr:Eukaryotic RNA Recognition Motif (RRM) profile [Nakaseomyces glabratus]QNG12284.1 uncharacterized protein GWK60_A04103 [Nakaseomyces glabratus]SCV15895.1 related to RNA-binding protein PIN4 [Nakaseomyces glabratus]SLM15483.1 related to RNA-binding protein PIN4 [Nakaseomyces glabratus]